MKRKSNERNLRDLRGIGKSIEANLRALGVQTTSQLAKSDGLALYERLNKLTGSRQDPCVLDTFRCVVAQARDEHLALEQKDWWWWSNQRKQDLL